MNTVGVHPGFSPRVGQRTQPRGNVEPYRGIQQPGSSWGGGSTGELQFGPYGPEDSVQGPWGKPLEQTAGVPWAKFFDAVGPGGFSGRGSLRKLPTAPSMTDINLNPRSTWNTNPGFAPVRGLPLQGLQRAAPAFTAQEQAIRGGRIPRPIQGLQQVGSF